MGWLIATKYCQTDAWEQNRQNLSPYLNDMTMKLGMLLPSSCHLHKAFLGIRYNRNFVTLHYWSWIVVYDLSPIHYISVSFMPIPYADVSKLSYNTTWINSISIEKSATMFCISHNDTCTQKKKRSQNGATKGSVLRTRKWTLWGAVLAPLFFFWVKDHYFAGLKSGLLINVLL